MRRQVPQGPLHPNLIIAVQGVTDPVPPDPSPVRRLWGGAGAGSPSRRGLRGPAGDAARAATMAALNQQVHLVSLKISRKTDRLSSRRDISLCFLHHSSVQLVVETRNACNRTGIPCLT